MGACKFCESTIKYFYIFFILANRKSFDRQLSKDDIGHQARVLLNQFIFDRMERDGIEQIPAAEEFQEPGTPTG